MAPRNEPAPPSAAAEGVVTRAHTAHNKVRRRAVRTRVRALRTLPPRAGVLRMAMRKRVRVRRATACPQLPAWPLHPPTCWATAARLRQQRRRRESASAAPPASTASAARVWTRRAAERSASSRANTRPRSSAAGPIALSAHAPSHRGTTQPHTHRSADPPMSSPLSVIGFVSPQNNHHHTHSPLSCANRSQSPSVQPLPMRQSKTRSEAPSDSYSPNGWRGGEGRTRSQSPFSEQKAGGTAHVRDAEPLPLPRPRTGPAVL
jgi:hypothetical protein